MAELLNCLSLSLFALTLWCCALGQQPKRDDTHVDSVVRQAVADEFSSEINTNRTRAYLSCESGEMLVKLNFSEPFRGVAYADYDRSSPCRFYGDGRRYYELHIPLKGCGTKQEAPRLFINNIIVRFHRSLELEEDEIKTIICRYPPPFAPTPNNVVAPILAPIPPLPALIPPKLSEIELLLIICALLFLTLLLLGIGIAYYCLKKRNIKVVKKRKAMSSAPGSEITKLSGSTMGTLSMFDPIRIPRAIAQSTSGSEAALLTSMSGSGDRSDTIPSDYPSESPSSVNSDVEEVDGRRSLVVSDLSTLRQDRYRFENVAYIPDELPGYPVDAERAESVSSIPVMTVVNRPVKEPPKPRVAMEQTLTTIHEREDIMTQESWDQRKALVTTVQQRPMLPPPVATVTHTKRKAPSIYAPSLYGSIPDNDNRSDFEVVEAVATHRAPSISTYAPSLYGSIPDNDNWSHTEMVAEAPVRPFVRKPKVQMATLTDYYLDTQDTTDIREDTTRIRQELVAERIPEEVTEVTETTIVPMPKKPKITVQHIDDLFLTTTHEIDASEHVTRMTRDVTEDLMKPPATPEWDVTIRHYPAPESGPTSPQLAPLPAAITSETERTSFLEDISLKRTWDSYSEVSEKYRDAESTVTTAVHRPRPSPPSPPPRRPPSPPESLESLAPLPAAKPPPPPSSWDVLFRVLNPPSQTTGLEELTIHDKERWRSVLTTDTVFRELIQEAVTVEEFVRISRDQRYVTMFKPRTWQVIIRILTAPSLHPPATAEPTPEVRPPRYRKKSETDLRRRSSGLPPVNETDPSAVATPGSVRSRRTSRSGSVWDYDMRSMTEEDVDFTHADRESVWSEETGYTYRTGRSIAERSSSEFLEDVPTLTSRQASSGVRSRYEVNRNYAAFSSSTGDLRAAASSVVTTRGSSSEAVSHGRGSPLVRAMDLASSIGEREDVHSVTETDIYDWNR